MEKKKKKKCTAKTRAQKGGCNGDKNKGFKPEKQRGYCENTL